MKRNIKNKLSILITIIICGVIFTNIGVFAATKILAKDISFTSTHEDFKATNVEEALDELYSHNKLEAEEVMHITSQGQSYTFQNDGYVLGTIKSETNASAIIYFNEHDENQFDGGVSIAPYSSRATFNVRLYAPKGTVLYTRKSFGTYDITLYEFK